MNSNVQTCCAVVVTMSLPVHTESFSFEALVEIAVQLKEFNSCPNLPFFHGIVLAEKPMLVFEFMQVSCCLKHDLSVGSCICLASCDAAWAHA